MRVAITGSSGLVGTALRHTLERRGDTVTRVVRSFKNVAARERVIVWHPEKGEIEAAKLEGYDAVVNLAGESIANIWTPGKRREIRDSRVLGTALLATTLAARRDRPAVLVSMSASNYYGTGRGAEVLDETAPAGTGFLAETIVAWERAADPAREAGIRVVHPRMAPILSPDGGLLRVLLPLFRLGLGARVGSGDQYVPWVALDDAVRALLFFIDHPELEGPFNVAAPDRVTHAQLTQAIARAVERPLLLRVPAFAATLAPGNMAEELVLSGPNLSSERLQQAGFRFDHPELNAALRGMIQKR